MGTANVLQVQLSGDNTAWIAAGAALIGVIVGGLINGGMSWLLGRGTARASAYVAALLVTEELMASMPALLDTKDKQMWGTLGQAHDFGKRTSWEANRSILGHRLSPDGYMTLAATYNGLSGAAARASEEQPDTKLSEGDGWALASTFLALNRSLSFLGLIVHAPPQLRFIARLRQQRKHHAYLEQSLAEDPKYQAFMARYGHSNGHG